MAAVHHKETSGKARGERPRRVGYGPLRDARFGVHACGGVGQSSAITCRSTSLYERHSNDRIAPNSRLSRVIPVGEASPSPHGMAGATGSSRPKDSGPEGACSDACPCNYSSSAWMQITLIPE